jgi:sialidase-1
MPTPIPEPYSLIVCPATPEHPRNGEADMIRLKNGDLLLAYGRWNSGQSDFDTAEVWCKTSTDGGRTWGGDRVLVANESKLTTFSVSLLRLKSGEILMAYLTKNSKEDCSIFFRKSSDECRTWSPRMKFEMPEGYSGYTGMNNNRFIHLKSGRILAAAWDVGFAKSHVMLGFTLYSDDNGATWKKSTDVDMRVLDPADKGGAQEPNVTELKDGRVLMLIRNGFGCIAKSYSTDHGETWSKPELIRELEAPVAPSSIFRIPQTGDLLLVWNRNPKLRNPLNSAISKDEGKTWESIRTVDDNDGPPWPGLAYTSITPVGDNIILTYWFHEPTGVSLKLKIIDYRWFYEQESKH